MAPIIIQIERIPQTITFNGETIEVEKLGVPLPFARKPCDLSDLGGGENYTVYITETRTLTPAEFDEFAKHLLRPREWLTGKGGYFREGRLCVAVTAPERPWLFVDPSGESYGRYVARVG